ncbi:type IV conjugative transfer system coupling protein TraD [Enterobacter sp.]|uniref:type IV conjugative transfer system coupling protein TraD n=1 Tax=Enterobacter sp. TaxID=42895 RepID=UPI00296F6CE1|nr:type IV conjugative transfer system coupling protein TraD [Enterobacter sp.]
MSFAGKNLTQGGQMTAYRWRMFIQVNNWIGFWVLILFILITSALFLWRTPQEMLDNGALYWFANLNQSFIDLMPAGAGRFYDIHYYHAPTQTSYLLKMTLVQIYADPYMNAMGEQVLEQLQWVAMASAIFCTGVFVAVSWYIARIGKQESEDQYISGMQLTDKPSEVNRLLRQNGELSDLRVGELHMVQRAEVMNFLIHGTIGVGKSTIIRWLLNHIRKRGDRAIIYDSGCTFTETHYDPRTDIILNAHDERCANWQMWGECVDAVDYDNIAASLIPVEGDSDPFWVSSSRTIYADLAIRMSADPDRSIEKFLKTLLSLSMQSLREYLANTPAANLVEEKIEKTAISIRSVVTNYAKSLRYLQGLDDGIKPPFTIREWMTTEKYDNSWLFISTQARHRKSVRPLISLWVSLATLMLQSMGENSDRRVWFIFDELPSLQRIPEFNETLAEGRKFGGCFVVGVQNMAQLVHAYGRELAKSMFDLLNTRMYGRSPSAEMAEIVQKELGNQRKREIREQNSYGMDSVRDGVSLGKDKVNNPIVDYEQIMRLPNLNFYVRLPGEYPVIRLGLKYKKPVKRHAGLLERNIRDALSPELEKVILENERAATAAGLTFPTGDEVLESHNGDATTPPASPPPVTPHKGSLEKSEASIVTSTQPVRSQTAQAEAHHETAIRSQPVHAEKHNNLTDNVVVLKPLSPVKNPTEQEKIIAAPAALQPVIPASGSASAEELSNVTPALASLRKFRQQAAVTTSDETDEGGTEGGETLNLDMHITSLADGGLELSTAGTPDRNDDQPAVQRASKSLAQDDENILVHRHPDDPGYSDFDLNYDEGERDL